MTGAAGVPTSGVAAVSLNVTVIDPIGAGFVTVYPCGDRPLTSSLNFATGQVVPNAVIAPVSPNGEVCFYSSSPTPPRRRHQRLVRARGRVRRVVAGAGVRYSPRRGTGRGVGRQAALRRRRRVDGKVTGVAGVPAAGVGAVSLNVTVVDPVGSGFVTVYPCGARPLASNLNFTADQVTPNAVIAPLSPTERSASSHRSPTHVLADINGCSPRPPSHRRRLLDEAQQVPVADRGGRSPQDGFGQLHGSDDPRCGRPRG